jgi:hypothetical protein
MTLEENVTIQWASFVIMTIITLEFLWQFQLQGLDNFDVCLPQTLHPTPYTLHPTPYTLHPTLYTLHSTLYTLHSTLYTLHPTPFAIDVMHYTINPTP